MIHFDGPVFWFTLSLIFLGIELMGFGAFFAIVFAFGAFLSALASFFTDNLIVLVGLFLFSSLVFIFTLKPVLEKTLKIHRTNRTSTVDSLIGSQAIVTRKITKTEKGYAKINHEEWAAASIDGKEIEEDVVVVIEKIEGATVFVRVFDENEGN